MSESTTLILDGKTLAQKIQQELKAKIAILKEEKKRAPGLAVIMVGDNPASKVYVRNKELSCEKVGIVSFGKHFPADVTERELIQVIDQLNEDERVDGILIQLPLPPHFEAVALLQRITPAKDVDGLHPLNLGRLVRSETSLRSCTPAGVMALLDEYNIKIEGKKAVVIGRSILVGKPLALMLLERNATVTIAHSRTENLAEITRQADILVGAVGKPNLITKTMVKEGAIVIDVGINRGDTPGGKSKLVGDVAYEEVKTIAQGITPVPGGVGPMTVAMLLKNTVLSYEQR